MNDAVKGALFSGIGVVVITGIGALVVEIATLRERDVRQEERLNALEHRVSRLESKWLHTDDRGPR